MKKILQIALGILSAIGGFVDIGDLLFNTQAGATFGTDLIWVVVVGVVGIIVYSEMCGRVAAISGRPVFDLIRERVGFRAGLITLIASEFVNLMTLTAEVGGVAIALQLLTGLPYHLLIPLSVLTLVCLCWFLNFTWIERLFGYMGLLLIVFIVAALDLHPSWKHVADGLVPQISTHDPLVYLYFVVGLLGAALTPYEVYFYSSGAVEDGWSVKDLNLNRITATVGYMLGGLLSVALMIVAARVFLPNGIDPQLLGTTALGAQVPLGETSLIIALIGILFAVGGAATETSFAGAYNLSQFFGWEWGKHRRASTAPRFTLTWLLLFAIALVALLTGIEPVKLTEYSVIFSAVALPLTYLPILMVANDKVYMGDKTNGLVANVLGWLYLFLIVLISIAAVPLLLLTHGGQG